MSETTVVGVLALQGAFVEHIKLLKQAVTEFNGGSKAWDFREIRTVNDLVTCDALIIPGGESTTISLVAARSGLLEPLRDFVKVQRKPTWGTCAGLILLAESANRTKKGGQDLIGGLDVRVNRNHFGRQIESFEAPLDLPFLRESGDFNETCDVKSESFNGIFIRAPVIEKLLPVVEGQQNGEASLDETVIAPSKTPANTDYSFERVDIMASLPGRSRRLKEKASELHLDQEFGDIIVVKQGNVFGTSFHPELTNDARIHVWWLQQVKYAIEKLHNN